MLGVSFIVRLYDIYIYDTHCGRLVLGYAGVTSSCTVRLRMFAKSSGTGFRAGMHVPTDEHGLL
jgi:hypothetical protein